MSQAQLDNPGTYLPDDTMQMFRAAWELPAQCAAAWRIGRDAPVPPAKPYRNIVVTGLGGSAIGGDLLRVFTAGRLEIPVIVNRDYRLPRFVDDATLVFAVSYSGNTEETLSAYDDARGRGAAVVALTTGGRLGERARRDMVPLITIPAGTAPRAATGYLFLPTLAVLERLGLLDGMDAEVDGLVRHLEVLRRRYGPDAPSARNPAKQLAHNLYERLPVIWGVTGTTEVAAQRWKGQINENAKAPAYWNAFPELNHNEIVGFEQPVGVLRGIWLVVLRDPEDHPRVNLRVEITRSFVGTAAGMSEFTASGPTRLARLYSLIYLGDYTSLYLAVLYGTDPGPVRVIDRLKAELGAKSPA
ncbi:MAG: bifunctional phosphoglucose/phosphomannose isomerase [Desulfotomaculales bacterium]